MIITRTAYRISFFGGGSDYPAWYEKHGGRVLSATIDKYCYINLRRMPRYLGTKYRVFWSQAEAVNERNEIKHPSVRGCLEYLGIDDEIEINHAGDLPARSGLGSSSAFTVGMIHALRVLQGQTDVDKGLLAADAIAVEQDVLKETVGIQDQIACAWGGLNDIEIDTDGKYAITQCFVPKDFTKNLMLVFTGLQRYASEIAATQIARIDVNADALHEIAAMVPAAADALRNSRYDEFGRMLDRSWRLKRSLSDQVSNETIDDIYAAAIKAGALGGKMLGAGGGGFMLLFVPPDRRTDVHLALPGLITSPVRLESHGSQLVLSDG